MEWISGNIFVRPMGGSEGLAPGALISGHTHNFDHTSLFFGGRWRVRRWRPAVSEDGAQLLMPDGTAAWVLLDDFERDGPFHLLIEAGCRHEFTYRGHRLPDWMAPYLAQLPDAQAAEFRRQYGLTNGKAWCCYSHRSAQGDISETATGWTAAYE